MKKPLASFYAARVMRTCLSATHEMALNSRVLPAIATGTCVPRLMRCRVRGLARCWACQACGRIAGVAGT